MHSPTVSYTHYVKDAYAFWHLCDDSLNVSDHDDNAVCINGVNAKSAFCLAHSILANGRNCFEEFKDPNDHHINYAKSMIKALENFVRKNEPESNDD